MSVSDYRESTHSEIDPTTLRGLAQAAFILECLCKAETEENIIAKFRGDEQLVRMWVSFLRHNGWVKYDTVTQRWSMTDKARTFA